MKKSPTVIDLIEKHQVSLVINLSEDYNNEGSFKRVITDGYLIRRAAIDNNIPLIYRSKFRPIFCQCAWIGIKSVT